MSYPVTFTLDADDDLAHIESYLAERFYPLNARRFADRLYARCLRIGLVPLQGTSHSDLSEGMRTTSFEGKVTIFYAFNGSAVEIAAISYRGFQPEF